MEFALEDRFVRQLGLVDRNIFITPVCIVGAGGIGSFTALALAKIGFNRITVWDMDTVEEHNLPNQFYPLDAVGHSKVEALGTAIRNWTGTSITEVNREWADRDRMSGVVVMAVDNMRTRADVYNAVKGNKSVSCFVDGRMGRNQLEVYTCNMSKNDKRLYAKTLYSDDETPDIPCTERAVMYNVLNIASWITNQVRLVLSKKPYKQQLIMDLENMLLVIPEERRRGGECR